MLLGGPWYVCVLRGPPPPTRTHSKSADGSTNTVAHVHTEANPANWMGRRLDQKVICLGTGWLAGWLAWVVGRLDKQAAVRVVLLVWGPGWYRLPHTHTIHHYLLLLLQQQTPKDRESL